jgi:sodium-coupled neutral amino acid transporter 11
MCLAMGIAGFLSFGSKTQGNVLNNFPSDNIVVNIARLYSLPIGLDIEFHN